MSVLVAQKLDFGNSRRITNLAPAAAAGEPVVYEQMNAAINGLAWKDNVIVASQVNTTLSAPGAAIDGITLSNGERVLIRAQTAPEENGVYIFNGAAAAMTRATDAASAVDLEQAIVSVDEGTSAGVSYRQTAVNFTLGSGGIVWTTFGVAAAAASETVAGVMEIATQAETNTGTDDARAVSPLKLANWSGRKLKFSQDIGDGSATSYTVTHNLNTKDVQVSVHENSGSFRDVIVEVQKTSVNAVTIVFESAPASNAYRVVVLG